MIARVRKALVAGLGAGVAAWSTGMVDGNLSTGDWVTVVGSVLVVGVVTYLVPNKPAPKA